MKLGFSFEWTCLYRSYLQNSLKPGNSIPGAIPSLTLNQHLPCTRSWGLWAGQDYPWPNVHIQVGKETMQPFPLLITPLQNSKGKKKECTHVEGQEFIRLVQGDTQACSHQLISCHEPGTWFLLQPERGNDFHFWLWSKCPASEVTALPPPNYRFLHAWNLLTFLLTP